MPSPLTSADLAAAVPPVSGEVTCPGLEGPVTVFRDDFGIPHVRAASEHDAWFGQGYATAQDRLWQMEVDRRRAAGRWAEVVGRAALAGDLQMRRFRLVARLPVLIEALEPETRDMLAAYAAGVNAFIATASNATPGPLGIEFQLTGLRPDPWRPEDSLAVFLVRHILMGTWEAKVWRARLLHALGPERTAAFYPGYGSDDPLIVPPGGTYRGPPSDAAEALSAGLAHLTFLRHGIEDGSNNWVLDGARTASGAPLLAGDPHRALDAPNVYYQNHVACPGFDAIGFSFPGVPGFPHFAHNAHVAWGITHASADTQDLFVERFDRSDPPRYQYRGRWLEAERALESVAVRGEDPVPCETWSTRHGPVIAGDARRVDGSGDQAGGGLNGGGVLAFAYPALEAPNGTLDAVRKMVLAQNADQLEAALAGWVDPVNNLVYFDRDGQTGYRTRGALPVRHGDNAWIPVPGWDGEHDWSGRVPFAEMPRVRNPPGGVVVTANNRIVDENWPHYLAHEFAPGFRAQRIQARLEGVSGLTVEDMAAIQGDITSLPAAAFRPLYARIDPPDAACERALALLAQWDGQVEAGAPGPLVFAALRKHIVLGLLAPQLGPGLLADLLAATDRGALGLIIRTQARLHHLIAGDDRSILPPGESWPALLSRALGAAVAELTSLLGPDPDQWRWEIEHHTAAVHTLSGAYPEAAPLLDPPVIPMGGDGDTVQAAGVHATLDYRARFISVARYIFDGADWERSRWIVPGGASGHPGSPHCADQLPLYARHATVPMTFRWNTLAAQAAAVLTLHPPTAGKTQ